MNRVEKKAAIAAVQKVFDKLVTNRKSLQDLKTKFVARIEFTAYGSRPLILFKDGHWCGTRDNGSEPDVLEMGEDEWCNVNYAARTLKLITEEQVAVVDAAREAKKRRAYRRMRLSNLKETAENLGYTLTKKGKEHA